MDKIHPHTINAGVVGGDINKGYGRKNKSKFKKRYN